MEKLETKLHALHNFSHKGKNPKYTTYYPYTGLTGFPFINNLLKEGELISQDGWGPDENEFLIRSYLFKINNQVGYIYLRGYKKINVINVEEFKEHFYEEGTLIILDASEENPVFKRLVEEINKF